MHRFHPIQTDNTSKPKKFTYPFCYEPHPLCVIAAKELQTYIASIDEWSDEIARGKMFGVLVVEGEEGLGFLAAYSGLLAGRNDWPYFVPAIYDLLQPNGRFKIGETEISRINHQVEALENGDERRHLQAELRRMETEAEKALTEYKEETKHIKETLVGDERIRFSQFANAELRRRKKAYAESIAVVSQRLQAIDDEISAMKHERRSKSDELQHWLFSQYRMLNARGERRDLCRIFADSVGGIPPSGTGECCAPKLLQYAFEHSLRPVCMAEFWWGASPKTEVRHHLNYYPACRGKCKPILDFQLQGLDVDTDPRAVDEEQEMHIVYDDAYICVVGKPSGMLSVPGKSKRRSVLSEMRQRYPESEGPMIVHRLDMDTSGLMVVAKTTAAYHDLQRQFCDHTIRKKYVALLAHIPNCPMKGTISLPLRPDPLDRPRQVVDKEHGKEAVTHYRLTVEHGQCVAELFPFTGRTHQLRIHCAHSEGLAAPIVGDSLYGDSRDNLSQRRDTNSRLCLHAEKLSFLHPVTRKEMTFELKAAFCNRLVVR